MGHQDRPPGGVLYTYTYTLHMMINVFNHVSFTMSPISTTGNVKLLVD